MSIYFIWILLFPPPAMKQLWQVFASPTADAWITEQATTGNIVPFYPESMLQLIGEGRDML